VSVTRATIGNTGNMGLWIYSTGAVTLTDVKTWYNPADGIKVNTLGAITLTRVDTRFNLGHGAYLTNYDVADAVLVKPGVAITDSTFNNNNIGLWVNSKGAVALLGVNGEGNYQHGTSYSESQVVGGGTVTSYIGGLDAWNDGYLQWNAYGRYAEYSFHLDNFATLDFALTPDNNQIRLMLYKADGELLYDSYYYGETIELNDYDLDAGDYFVRVRALTWMDDNGHIWADPLWYNLTFNNGTNDLYAGSTYGAWINNQGALTVDKSAARGSSEFNGNGGDGLYALVGTPGGNVVIARTNIRGNQRDGLFLSLNAAGKTTVLTNVWSDDNEGFNVDITTKGPVTWTNGSSARSHMGTQINNQNTTTYVPNALTISNVDFYKTWDNTGLTIYSHGNVSLTSVGAWENTNHGVFIDNCGYDLGCRGSGTVTVNNSNGSAMENNGASGLYIISGGAVTITNLRAAWNEQSGIEVNNKWQKAGGGDTSGGVTFVYTKERSLDNNGYSAIYALSNGAIKLTTNSMLFINNNGRNGTGNAIDLSNDTSALATAPTVNVEGVLNTATGKYGQLRIENNNGRGLQIYSRGVVTVKYTSASWNRNTGIYIGFPYDQARKPSSVVLANVISQANGQNGENDSHGIFINGNGTLTASNLDINQNRAHGLYIETTGVVSIKKSLFNWSGSGDPADNFWGLWITTPKDVTLDGNTFNGNDHSLYVNTQSGSGKVSVLGTSGKNYFIGNRGDMTINSAGNVVMNRVDLQENGGNMNVSSSTGSVTFNTVNVLSNTFGLRVMAQTGASFTKVTGLNNGIRYDDPGTPWDDRTDADGIRVTLYNGNASFTDCAFSGNTGNGIEVYYAYTTTLRPTLVRTTYFGNDSDHSGDPNLLIQY